MKLFHVAKDGGPQSTVTGYWLIELKSLLSVCLLKFDGPSREVFHTHAFNAISWVLKGGLTETFTDGRVRRHRPSIRPIYTPRGDFHKVDSDEGVTWVLTLRGPWVRFWREFDPVSGLLTILSPGRKTAASYKVA